MSTTVGVRLTGALPDIRNLAADLEEWFLVISQSAPQPNRRPAGHYRLYLHIQPNKEK